MSTLTKLKKFYTPILNAFKSAPLEKEIFENSLVLASGFESERENPDKLLEDLARTVSLYDIMLLDDRIKMALELKKRLVLAVPADIVPASEEQADLDIAQEVREQLKINNTSIYDHQFGYSFWSMLDQAMNAQAYGYKVAEKVWSIQEGKTVFSNMKFQRSIYFDFDYDEHRNLDQLIIGRNFGQEKIIRGIDKINDKFSIFSWPYIKDGNVYGESILMSIYEQFKAKKHIQRQRNIYLEKYGTPIPIVKYDVDQTSQAEVDEAKDLLDNFQDGSYFLSPAMKNDSGDLIAKFDFSIVETKGKGSAQFNEAIDQIDKQITRGVLFPDKLGFSESPGGSYNLAEQQTDIMFSDIEYIHQWLEAPTDALIKQIVDFNFTTKKYPTFRFKKLSNQIKGDMLTTLIDKGVIDKREKWIRQYTSVPEITEEEQAVIDEKKEEDRKQAMEDMAAQAGPINKDDDKKPNANPKDNPIKNQHVHTEQFLSKKNPFDAKSVQAFLDAQEEQFIEGYLAIRKEIDNRLVRTVVKKDIVSKQDLKAKEALRIDKRELKAFYQNQFIKSYLNGRVDAVLEVKPRIDTAQQTVFKVFRDDSAIAIELKKKKITYKFRGMTSVDGQSPHSHEYLIDDNGEGQTVATNGEGLDHVHTISNFIVTQAGLGNHDHELEGHIQFANENGGAVDFASDISDELNEAISNLEGVDRDALNRILSKVSATGDLGKLSTTDMQALKILIDKAFENVGAEEARILNEVQRIIDQGIRGGLTTAQSATQIRDILAKDRQKFATTIARTGISDNYNKARLDFFTGDVMRPLIQAYQYLAVIDDATTQFCRSHDGQIIAASDPGVTNINPPNHFNCRSVLVAILVGEDQIPGFYENYPEKFDLWGLGVPKDALEPAVGFGGTP